MRVTQVEKLTLAIFTAKLKEITNRSAKELGKIMFYFNPRPCWAGIESWFAANGRINTKGEGEDHGSVRKLKI